MNKVVYGKRIRYTKHPEDPANMLRAVKNFKVGEDYYFLDLHKVSFQFNIRNTKDNSLVASGGNTKNLAVLKIQAKKALEDLGITFAQDVRTFKEDKVEDTNQLSMGRVLDDFLEDE